MANEFSVDLLKNILREEVDAFCDRQDPTWQAVSDVLNTVRLQSWRAALFGGTLRSLLISRLHQHRSGRPRDIDLVIQGPSVEALRTLFQGLITRETRFGGLQLRKGDWLFDVWPLDRTWALVQDNVSLPNFSDLPRTTFLNVEAIAVDLWPMPARQRQIYSGDDQFFHALLDGVVEINRADNPFPGLCVVRSLVMAHDLGFRVGPKLAQFIAHHGPTLPLDELQQLQEKHYGTVRLAPAQLREWAHLLRNSLDDDTFHGFPFPDQAGLLHAP